MYVKRGWRPFGKGAKIFGMVVIGLLTAVIFGLLFGYFVELLWNWLMPEIFKLGKITYWQAFGLVLLARLIFGSIGHDHPSGHPHRRYHHWHKNREYGGMNWREWNYYDRWWHEEGRAAFEKYMAEVEHKEETFK